MGTLGAGPPGRLEAMAFTTPGPIEIHRRLASMRDAGIDMLAMEVSSHALDQRRIEGVRVDTAVFTNLSRDHLDYHPDMDAYARAKASLFAVPGLANAVVNVDDRFGRELVGTLPAGVASVALTLAGARPATAALPTSRWPSRSPSRSHVVAGRVVGERPGLSLHISTPWGSGTLETRLLGRFNAHNLLAAVAVACLHGNGLDAVLGRLRGVEPLAGRMQRLGGGSCPLVVVDYSHTPDALRSALAALRPLCAGTLWCVFGCGGERDRGKRPQMAEAAEQGADRVVVTDDNPRGEDADAIVADIMAGFARPDAVCIERDRARAIHGAVTGAGVQDVVLLAGKGHETTQERAGVVLPFSDAASARHALGSPGMIRMRLGEAAATLGLRAPGEDVAFRGVSTDSRTTAAGALFVAVRGPMFDGHDFVGAAAARGAAAALVERAPDAPAPIPFILARDSVRALAELAAAWRRRFHDLVLVGITGSNGKTTVKEMVAAILRTAGPVSATRATSTTRSGSRSRSAASTPDIAARWSRWGRTTVARSRRSPRSPGPRWG